jgi:hypothetical protein
MTSSLFTTDYNPPQELLLLQENIVIFPTNTDYSNEDYEAVIVSREFLHVWGGDTWPDHSFSPQDNFDDLSHHVEDNITHRAYGYMIFTADRKKCLGSVYINPLASWPNYHNLTAGTDPRENYDARIDYWTRSDMPELELTLIPKLTQWFHKEWKIKPLLVSKPGFTVRNKIIHELKLEAIASFHSKFDDNQLTMYKML